MLFELFLRAASKLKMNCFLQVQFFSAHIFFSLGKVVVETRFKESVQETKREKFF